MAINSSHTVQNIPPTDPNAAIQWHVTQICELAETYVAESDADWLTAPARIAEHKARLARLGIDETALLSWINRATVPAEA